MKRVFPSLEQSNPAVVSAIRSQIQQEREIDMAAVLPQTPYTSSLLCESLQVETKDGRGAGHLELLGGLTKNNLFFLLVFLLFVGGTAGRFR